MKTTIYHNPRCRKSREGLAILEESKLDVEIIKYLDEVPSVEELQSLLKKLNMKAIDLVRTNEKIWKEAYRGKDLSESEILEAMHQHPKLIERPIVLYKDKAVVGRPPERISTLISKSF